jgi:hypothetical protein
VLSCPTTLQPNCTPGKKNASAEIAGWEDLKLESKFTRAGIIFDCSHQVGRTIQVRYDSNEADESRHLRQAHELLSDWPDSAAA